MPGYCFDKDINPSVDSYFCEVPVEDWSLASFQLHKNKEDTSFPALNQLFTDNLKKIAATSGLPRYVYSVVGRLINDREVKISYVCSVCFLQSLTGICWTDFIGQGKTEARRSRPQ
jgi:hypothetical protein